MMALRRPPGPKGQGRHVNIQEIRELIRMRPPELHAADRRLAHCHDVADLRRAYAARERKFGGLPAAAKAATSPTSGGRPSSLG